MNPKKAKELIAEEAVKQDIPEKDLGDMVREFYKMVKSNMENFGSRMSPQTCIGIPGLGRMRIRQKALEEGIEKLEKYLHLKTHRRKPMVEHRSRLRKMKKCMKVHRNHVWELRQLRKKRNILKTAKQANNESKGEAAEDMGEQVPDS